MLQNEGMKLFSFYESYTFTQQQSGPAYNHTSAKYVFVHGTLQVPEHPFVNCSIMHDAPAFCFQYQLSLWYNVHITFWKMKLLQARNSEFQVADAEVL